jgi:hypothetical protein
MIALHILMSFSVTMAELENLCARFVEMPTVFTNARNVLVGVFIVGNVSLNDIHLILCIGLRCVHKHVDALIS